MLQVSVFRFSEMLSCILGDASLCFQHMFSASAPPPFGPYPKRIKIWQRWEAEILKVLTLKSSELRKGLSDGSTSRRHWWVSRIHHHLQYPKHPTEANIQTGHQHQTVKLWHLLRIPNNTKNIAYDYLTPVCAKIKPVEQNSWSASPSLPQFQCWKS